MTEIDFAYFNRHQRGGRVDRIYVTGELRKSGAVLSCAQKDCGGGHHMIMITVGRDELARARPPGFRP